MGKIFCLMGKSSSGKDTLFTKLMQQFSDKLQPIIPYTTRPMRTQEVDGQAYYFISEEILESYRTSGKVIEERVYQTVHGPWYYATIDDGNINIDKQDYIMITTLEAYNHLVSYYQEGSVLPIYIYVEDGIRLERALNRERNQINPNYDELCRRFLADSKDFSSEKLEQACISKGYNNIDIDVCIDEISNFIRTQI